MDAVIFHGTPPVEDPQRVKKVRALGIDETSFLSATRDPHTISVTGLVDLDRKRMIDLVEGNGALDLRTWCAALDKAWLRAVRVVATDDLAESYRSARRRTSTMPSGWPIPSTWCASPIAASTRCAGASRTRRWGTGLGLRRGDPRDELWGAWLAKESVRDFYLTDDPKEARVLLDSKADEVEEIRSLDDTLERWHKEILNHLRTGASNGPTEGLNLCVKKVKRAGRGFTCFEHYRLRVLHLDQASMTAKDQNPLSPA